MGTYFISDVDKYKIGESSDGEVVYDFLHFYIHLVHCEIQFYKRSVITLITGRSGAGKSYLALRLGEAVDGDNFDPRLQIAYDAAQFLIICKAILQRRGLHTIILDEAQTTISSRNWYSYFNKAVNYVLTTFRGLKRIHLIIVTPYEDEIDVHVRRLANFVFNVEKKHREYIFFVPKMVMNIRESFGEIKTVLSSIVLTDRNKSITFDKVFIGLPSEETIKVYEEMARKFKGRILEHQIQKLIKIDKEHKAILEEFEKMVMGENA